MKKKSKFIIKSNSSGSKVKVYIGGKWRKNIYSIQIGIKERKIYVSTFEYKRNAEGNVYTVKDVNGIPELAKESKLYLFER